jgi:cyanophycin synthetase
MAAHLAEGKDGVFVEDGAIVTAHAGRRERLVDLKRVGFTAGGTIGFQLENALAATAAAWASGLNPAMIVRALSTFRADPAMAPGRFNLLEIAGRQVIADYGHNIGAMRALGEALPRDGVRKTLMVVGLPGDRRDEDLLATFQATLPFVDEYVLHDLRNLRGRTELEVPMLMKSCLPPDKPYQFARSQREGILEAFRRMEPGDRLVVIVDEVDETMEVLQSLANAREEEHCTPLAAPPG